MNKNLRNGFKSTFNGFNVFINNLCSSIVSLLRMLVLSRTKVAIQSKKYGNLKTGTDCTILANGPSLKMALEKGEVRLEGNDVFVVNMFVQSPEFWTIKPRFYYLVDGAFFNPKTERHNQLVQTLKDAFNKVDWDMFLCISSGCANGGLIKDLHNDHIKVLRWNTTTFEGFRWLRHFMFRHNMAMPRCQTVTNFALAAAINMKYENVYLYGADHGWTKDLRVDDDNVVCYGDRHVYNTALTELKLNYSIAHLLRQYANMFESHWVINDYAKDSGVKIWNCTIGSFVDAYDRYNKESC